MALFESYERRIDKINSVLNNYGISSIEEAEKITKDAGLDVYEQVKKIQPICFENACWAYTVGAAIAIKKGCKKAADIFRDFSVTYEFAAKLLFAFAAIPQLSFALFLFASGVNDLFGIVNTSILSACFFICSFRIITFFDKVCHLAKAYEFITNDLIICVKCNACYITFCHFQVTRTFFQSTIHRTYLASQAFTQVFKTCANRKSFL